MKKGLINFLTGAGLIASTWFGYANSNFVESPRNKELDAKAKLVTPEAYGVLNSEKYQINGDKIEVYKSIDFFDTLNIKINDAINFESEDFFDREFSKGDARNLAKVTAYDGEQWHEIKSPERFQKAYEGLIEKVYKIKKPEREKTSAEREAMKKERLEKIEQKLEDLTNKL